MTSTTTPAGAGESAAAIAAEAARIRELQRRAFARPADAAAEADAARAAAELAAIAGTRSVVAAAAPRMPRPAASDAPMAGSAVPRGAARPRTDDPADSVDDDELDALERARAAWAAALARVRGLGRREWTIAAGTAGALGLATGILAIAHAALTAPPPAYAIFEPTAVAAAAGPEEEAQAAAVRALGERAIDVAAGPVLLPSEDDGRIRLVAYRQRITDDYSEICLGMLVDTAYIAVATCASDEEFRRSGLSESFELSPFRAEFAWAPSGAVTFDVTTTGAVTLDDVRALNLAAVEALENAPGPLGPVDIAGLPDDIIAGPLLLDVIDGTQYVGFLSAGSGSLDWFGTAPQFCIFSGTPVVSGGGCTTVEDFALNGASVYDGSGPAGTWLPSGEFVRAEQ